MKLQKTHIFLIVQVVLFLFSNVAAWMAWQDSQAFSQNIYTNTAFITLILLIIATATNLFLFFPSVFLDNRKNLELQEMTDSLNARTETLAHAAITDGLTGLHNRRYFDEAIEEYLDVFAKVPNPLGLIILDLDHFKKINDTYGHDVGDDVLREVSYCIKSHTRNHDVKIRLGGEEFAVLAPNTSIGQLTELGERLRIAISKLKIKLDDKEHLSITVSAGALSWNKKDNGIEFYKKADKLLYKSKRDGRNRVSSRAG